MRSPLSNIINAILSTGIGPQPVGSIPYPTDGLKFYVRSTAASSISDTGGLVDQWDDLSGNENHVTASGGGRPTTGSATINGLNAIEFDGSDIMQSAAFSSELSQPNTVIVIGRADLESAYYFVDGLTAGSRNGVAVLSAVTKREVIYSGTTLDSDVDVLLYPVIKVCVFNSTVSYIKINGEVITEGDAGSDGLDGVTLGARYSTATFLTGVMSIVLVYDRALSSDEIEAIEAHAAAEFAININVPIYALDFEASSSQQLSIAGSTFGALNDTTWTYHVWYKRESIGATMNVAHKKPVGTADPLLLRFLSGNTLDMIIRDGAGALIGRLVTSDTFADTSDLHQIIIEWDSGNATESDRIRVYHDQTRITSFSSEVYPTQNDSVDDSADGSVYMGSVGGSGYYDGLLYQQAWFSGINPEIADLHNSGLPTDLREVSGLISMLHANPVNGLEYDTALDASWTNTNSVVKSQDIPL